jgi:hypothetical protein
LKKSLKDENLQVRVAGIQALLRGFGEDGEKRVKAAFPKEYKIVKNMKDRNEQAGLKLTDCLRKREEYELLCTLQALGREF